MQTKVILIADDEELDRELIAHLLERNGFSREQFLFASDGQEAVSQTKAKGPELILLDIRMPVLSGLEALKQIRAFNKEAKVIIVSAYNEFDYAQEAMQTGASAYVLKPIKPTEFAQVIENVSKQVAVEREQATEIAAMRAHFTHSLPVLRQVFLSDLVLGNLLELADNEVLSRAELLSITPLPNTVAVAELKHFPGSTGNLTKELFKQQAADHLKEALRNQGATWVFTSLGGDKVLIFKKEEAPSYDSRSRLISLGESLCASTLEKTGIVLNIGIGRTYSSFRQLPDSYQEALQTLEQDILNNGGCIHIDDLEKISKNRQGYAQLLPRLASSVRSGKLQTAETYLSSIWHTPELEHALEQRKMQALEILNTIFLGANESGTELTQQLAYRLGCNQKVGEFEQEADLYNWLLETLVEIIEAINKERVGRNQALISQAQAYIKQNFKEQITLEEAARVVNLSPAYFSSIFKQETGISFIEYLSEVRMEEAKRLLENPKLNIAEICYEVGYNDQGYFTRVFKKVVGITPTQWREQVLKRVQKNVTRI